MRLFWMAGLLACFVTQFATPVSAQDMRLVMVEEDGCIYCALWKSDVGTEYPITDEGRAAPLLPVDINQQPPEGYSFARRVIFTPTFVLTVDGTEVSRLEGYPGEDFFWGLLGRMIAAASAPKS